MPGSWRTNRENIEKLKNRITDISARNESLDQKIRDIELLSARKDASLKSSTAGIREHSGTINELTKKSAQHSRHPRKIMSKTTTKTLHA
ncbi:MAG: hypothetical protein MZV63_43365 [Marinilabiliales bacterium]|nr:hypothetical protein [Marinilabiliales bacterium]